MQEVARCSSCKMCKVWEGDNIPADYICNKCIRLQLLEARVTELQLEIDGLRSIREAEKVIDCSYKEINTPKTIGKWETKRKTGKKQIVQGSPEEVTLSNSYSLLDAGEGDDLQEVSSGVQVSGTESVPVAKKVRGEKSGTVLIGDSLVRGTDRRFCGRNRDTRWVCCLPGARVSDVSERISQVLKGEGEQPQVVVHIGTNDLGRKRDKDVRQAFKDLGCKLKGRTNRVVISGLLPAPRDSEMRNREREELNTWLKGWCRWEGFSFLDNWGSFWGKWDLYKQDGLHLNLRGTNILGARFANVTVGGLN